jgi:serine protease AprX
MMNEFDAPSRGASWGRSRRGVRAVRWVAGALVAVVVIPAVSHQPAGAAAYDPATDPYSMKAATAQIGATAWWNAGYTGAGVDVAVIDTGVAPVAGLDTAGKIIHGPDLSLESQAPNLRYLDTSGHGTFVAGLIAGKDATLTAPYANAPASAYRGVAPDARILSVKVGVADGGVDVSQVIAAINWVVQNKNANGMNVRVLNLSYGTNSRQSAGVDPLSFAVERAWKAGIVVVAAAGNTGYQRGNNAPGLANPAYNPFVIAAGGYDSMGTALASDDQMGTYSASSAGCGSLCKNPDLVAFGTHMQGLRVPNGFIDVNHPEGLLGTRYFRGSGSSQAAAIASGSIALVLQKYPGLTPDQVKRFIMSNAKKVAGADSQAQGAGKIDLATLIAKAPTSYVQKFTAATGSGTIDAARGTDRLTRDGIALSGEQDIFGRPWTASTAGSSWSGGTWNGSTWSGSTWSGSTWSGSTWSGSSWSGSSWSGSSWSGSSWSGSSWSGSSWSGSSWSGSSWSGGAWATGSWT